MSTFQSFTFHEHVLQAIEKAGYTTPTPIQAAAIPLLLNRQDVLASAQTGTGKTAAFALPIIQQFETSPRLNPREVKVLILAPTRELAMQIQESLFALARFSNLRIGCFYGGVSKVGQMKSLHYGLDIVVGTPGRTLDLVRSKALKLHHIDTVILDEADQMLDMGFLPDVKALLTACPSKRLTALFSATMPYEIQSLANSFMKDPQRVEVTPTHQPIEAITHQTIAIDKNRKLSYLIHTLNKQEVESALVFTRTKRGAKRTTATLKANGISADELHGNQSQVKRTEAMKKFKDRKVKVLVATDIASRGIDIQQLSHVINFDMPETPETFLHRIGRTARAGFSGSVYHLVSQEEYGLLKQINRHTGLSLKAEKDFKFVYNPSIIIAAQDEEPSSTGHGRYPRPKQDHFVKKPNHWSKSRSR